MPTCPNGHDSADADFCDVCGMRIGAAAPAAVGAAAAGSPAAAPGSLPAEAGGEAEAGSAAEPCPNCGAPRTGKFCETCGFDFSTGTPGPAASGPATVPPATVPPATVPPATGPAAATWTAVVSADREYFDSVIAAGGPDASAIEFPAYCPERRFRLTGTQMRIGRRSASRGLEPEIDLTGPPTDPGISHLQAVLSAEPDGSWSILDPGSSNGTQVNGSDIPTGVKVPVHDGDRIAIGGWTVLRIQAPV